MESMRLRDLNNMTRMRRRELGLPANPNPPEEVHDSGSESEWVRASHTTTPQLFLAESSAPTPPVRSRSLSFLHLSTWVATARGKVVVAMGEGFSIIRYLSVICYRLPRLLRMPRHPQDRAPAGSTTPWQSIQANSRLELCLTSGATAMAEPG